MDSFFRGGFEVERNAVVESLLSDCRKAHTSDNSYETIAVSLCRYIEILERWAKRVMIEWPLRHTPICFEAKCDRMRKEMQLQVQEINRVRQLFESSRSDEQKLMHQAQPELKLSEILDILSIQVGMLTIDGLPRTSFENKADEKQLSCQKRLSPKGRNQAYLDPESVWVRLYSPVPGCGCHSCARLRRIC